MNGVPALTVSETLAPQPWLDGPMKVAPRASPGRGRGVFATAPILPGEVIERACSVPLTSAQCDQVETIPMLGDIYFHHPEDPELGLVLLGLISLVNHADQANAEVRFTHSSTLGWIAELVCLHPIATGEEVTHCYNCAPWFAVV